MLKPLPHNVNGATLVEDLGMVKPLTDSKRATRMCILQCPTCDNTFTVIYSNANRAKQCVCNECKGFIKNKDISNLFKTMKKRCYNSNSPTFVNYGGRGITICNEWIDNPFKFENWCLANGYTKGLSIDRVDNDKGYYPENCRFVSRCVQARNTRKLKTTNKSGYRGVNWHKGNNRWDAGIKVNSRRKHLGSFKTAIEAAKAYDNYVISNSLEHTINGVGDRALQPKK